jgi:hypothetical protein
MLLTPMALFAAIAFLYPQILVVAATLAKLISPFIPTQHRV